MLLGSFLKREHLATLRESNNLTRKVAHNLTVILVFRRSLDGLVCEIARFVNAFAFICLFILPTVVAVTEVGGRPLCKKCKKTPAVTGHDEKSKRCYKEKQFF